MSRQNRDVIESIYPKKKREDNQTKDTIQEQESENIEDDEIIKSGVSKVVQFNPKKPIQYACDSKYICNVENTILESLVPIPYADEDILTEEKKSTIEGSKKASNKDQEKNLPFYELNPSTDLIEAINEAVVKREAKRAKIDITCLDANSPPPTVEPRKQMRPIPPIPPRKAIAISNVDISEDVSGDVINVHHKPDGVGVKKKAFLEEPTQVTSEISELLMSTKTKTLTNKKKNSLLAKRRKVSLKLLENNATIQGHLYLRAKDKSEVAYWIKLYFVLIDTALYGFKIKESSKADCVVYLSGFTVSTAKEVHSKANSFKVYHPKKTFYMAAETETAMNQWMEYIKQATMKGTTNLECDAKELYSETECSDGEDSNVQLSRNNSQLSTSLPLSQEKTLLSAETTSPSHSSSSSSKHHYHLNFGSLKKTFARSYNSTNENNSNDNKFLGLFSSNKSEKKGTDIIIPTAQFKTYRKVKENNGGLQLGATSMINSNISDLYLSANNTETLPYLTKLSTDTKDTKDDQNIINSMQKVTYNDEESPLKTSKQPIRKTLNFLHASNPNLLEYNSYQTNSDFPTSSNNPCSSSTNAWDHQTTGTQMTLLDLMLQQREEESKDMYTKRVDQGLEQGFEKNDDKLIVTKKLAPKAPDPHIEKIQKRSLPNTPDYVLNFKLDDRAILYARSKEGLKLRDFGYELIPNDDSQQSTISTSLNPLISESRSYQENSKMWPSSKRKIVPLSGSVKKKSGFGWMSSQEESSSINCNTAIGGGAGGSFRKLKKSSNNNEKTLSNSSSKNENLVNTQDLASSSSSSKIAYFSKLSFANSNVKEKKLLGSPKLHRAIFGKNSTTPQPTSNDDEIFSSITFPKVCLK